MQQKTYILVKNYIEVKIFKPLTIYCTEGRYIKLDLMDSADTNGEHFLLARKDFLYEQSNTAISMCHLIFKGDDLSGLEITELDFFDLLSKKDYKVYKKEIEEFKKDYEEHKKDYEEHKKENATYEEKTDKTLKEYSDKFDKNDTEHAEFNDKFTKNDAEHKEIRELIKKVISTTYADLKTLRNNKNLNAGSWYRITDYNFTPPDNSTTIKSAGHQFDILVLATDTDKLNENALAVAHDGDTYFANSNLNAWVVKYTLDYNKYYHLWTNGTYGVIYYLKDEFDNECNYDFKNLLMIRYQVTATNYADVYFSGVYRCFTFLTSVDGWTINTANPKYFYTFSNCDTYNQDEITDAVITNPSKGRKPRIHNNKMFARLDDNRFTQYYYEDWGANCVIATPNTTYPIFITNINIDGFFCFNNTFNVYPLRERVEYNNINFGDFCSKNTIAMLCEDITFGSSCYENIIGVFSSQINFGNYCYRNFIGQHCDNITFGNYCFGNILRGAYTQNIKLNSGCSMIGFYYIYALEALPLPYVSNVNYEFTSRAKIIHTNSSSSDCPTSKDKYLKNLRVVSFKYDETSTKNYIEITNDHLNRNYVTNFYVDKDGNNTSNDLGY